LERVAVALRAADATIPRAFALGVSDGREEVREKREGESGRERGERGRERERERERQRQRERERARNPHQRTPRKNFKF